MAFPHTLKPSLQGQKVLSLKCPPGEVENDLVALIMGFNMDAKGSIAGVHIKCLELVSLSTRATVNLPCGQRSLGTAEDLRIYTTEKNTLFHFIFKKIF